MRRLKRLGAVAVAVAFCLAPVAIAQTPAGQILLSEQRPAQGTVVLGEVTAEVHQKTVFSKTSPRALLDEELRAKAAKLGADAVVGVTYDFSNALMSAKGNHARGTAVKMNPGALASAAPAPQPKPSPAPASQPSPSSTVAAAPAAVPAASPVASPAPMPAAPTAAPLLVDGVLLSEGDLPGRAYKVLGAINAEIHIKTVRSKQKPRDLLDADLKAKAKAMGADAVIQIRYDFNNALLSSKGNHATGVAVKFDR